MRRALPFLVTSLVLGVFVWTLIFLYKKSETHAVVHATATPVRREVIQKTVAPGALVPRKEVTIKPRVSGVIEKLYVEPGDYVKANALLAKIQIIPNVVSLNQAEANLKAARISFETAKSELERFRRLLAQNLISEADFIQQELSFKLRQQEVEAAENNLQLVREGASAKSGKASNLVHSTVEGMVLEVPVKEGASVIEANNFNEGTTIASIANMNDMIFQGRVDESEVGKLKVGMPVSISVGALGEQRFGGTLEYIAPKGVEKEGTIEFEVRAAVKLEPDVFVRANYSANADIILDRRADVLAVNEAWVIHEGKQAFVEIETGPQQFERKPVHLGLSDGIWVEVTNGLDERTRIKKQDPGALPASSG
ncbi:MAG TPA: efflux RND transporter periplasmic adaptor subunit [Polyangiaceae bacterium]|nr:efflux RND transporter periplasmic adaptor subunit [Polyangiaceae bacterium]